MTLRTLTVVMLFAAVLLTGCSHDVPEPTAVSLPPTVAVNRTTDSPDTALVLIDMQLDFWQPATQRCNPQLEMNVIGLLATCREQGIPVIHVRTAMDDDMAKWPDSFRERFHGSIPCVRGTAGAASLPFSDLLPREVVIEKCTFDAFATGELDTHLRSHGISNVLVAGMTTDVCVLNAALSAMNRGYTVTIVEDCCAAGSLAAHQFVLQQYDGLIFRRSPAHALQLGSQRQPTLSN